MPTDSQPEPVDWRTLPRKPASRKRAHILTVNVTAAEDTEIRHAARAAELNLSDYIVRRVLGRDAR